MCFFTIANLKKNANDRINALCYNIYSISDTKGEDVMHNVYNKSNSFYLTDLDTNKTYFIGDKNDLIKFLAHTHRYDNEEKRYIFSFFDNLNFGNDYSYIYSEIPSSEDGVIYKETKKYPKKFMFVDGYHRIIDVRTLYDDIINYLENGSYIFSYQYANPYWVGYIDSENLKKINKRKRKQHRKLHKTYSFKGTVPRTKQARTIDDMFKNDEEYKDYHFKAIEDKIDKYPVWWDDTYRVVQGNWKKQHKVRHQYEIHSRKQDNWRYYSEEDYTIDEIDEIMFNEFHRHK